MRRLLRISLLAALGALAWVVARELLAESGDGADSGDGEVAGRPLEQKSRAELYEQAKRLKIEGRSKMSKDQLVDAIAAASEVE
jgi:NAD(P)H-hydrate repair Nnr-like enzyme with NAD(P)H-hydrate epimerase domain